jgi:hypothetical protein
MMASRVGSRAHSGIANWQVPTIISQFLIASSQANLQAKTQLSGNTIASG